MDDIIWDKDADQALNAVPFFVRGLVRRKLEERARTSGSFRVTARDFHEAEARFRATVGDKSRDEIAKMLPQDNTAGVELVVIEECHSALSQCPNVLIATADWARALAEWVRARDLSERLRRRVAGETILHHHKLRISLSGCPNGCSRPHIADIGLLGCVTPSVAPEDCTACGACATACPDAAIRVDAAPPLFDRDACQGCLRCRAACPHQCITLSPPAMRLLLGGKLGRHPHLAEVAGEFTTPEALIAVLDALVSDFLDHAQPGERFGDFLRRVAHPAVNRRATG